MIDKSKWVKDENFKRNASYLKKHIGKEAIFTNSYSLLERYGTIIEISGKNVNIGQDWLWIPDIACIYFRKDEYK